MGHFKSLPYIFKKVVVVEWEEEERTINGTRFFLLFFFPWNHDIRCTRAFLM